MKKIFSVMFVMMVFSNIAFSKTTENLYIVRDTQINEFLPELTKVLVEPTVKGNILYSDSNNYFIRLYEVDSDINIFLNCDKKDEKIFNEKIKSLGFRTYTFDDRDTKSRYISDFKNYIKSNNIFVSEVKDDKAEYKSYSKPLKNKIIKTGEYSKDGISFVTNRLEMRTKIKRYVDGYEIIVTNNTGGNIVLKKIDTGDFVALSEIAKKVMIPVGVDFIPIYGTVVGIKTDLEKNRFTRPFPVDYTLKQGESVRILGLAYHQVVPILDFIFEIGGKESVIQLNTY